MTNKDKTVGALFTQPPEPPTVSFGGKVIEPSTFADGATTFSEPPSQEAKFLRTELEIALVNLKRVKAELSMEQSELQVELDVRADAEDMAKTLKAQRDTALARVGCLEAIIGIVKDIAVDAKTTDTQLRMAVLVMPVKHRAQSSGDFTIANGIKGIESKEGGA